MGTVRGQSYSHSVWVCANRSHGGQHRKHKCFDLRCTVAVHHSDCNYNFEGQRLSEKEDAKDTLCALVSCIDKCLHLPPLVHNYQFIACSQEWNVVPLRLHYFEHYVINV